MFSPRTRLTLQTQLSLAFMPLLVDTVARAVLLHSVAEWYAIPDIVILLVTFSFFCFGVMFAVKQTSLNQDDEASLNVEVVKQKLLLIGLASMMAAGCVSVFRAVNERFTGLRIEQEDGQIIFYIAVAFVIYNSVSISFRYISYVGR
jgi:hypothetical protein